MSGKQPHVVGELDPSSASPATPTCPSPPVQGTYILHVCVWVILDLGVVGVVSTGQRLAQGTHDDLCRGGEGRGGEGEGRVG